MKQTTVGVFDAPDNAEKAVRMVHRRLSIPTDDITFLYRNNEGKLRELDVDVLEGEGNGTGAWTGVIVGLLLGAMLGVAVVAGLMPAVEPWLTGGPVARALASLGISATASTIGSTALLGAVLGAIIGGILTRGRRPMSLKSFDIPARAREILVAVNAPESLDIHSVFRNIGALDTRIYRLSI